MKAEYTGHRPFTAGLDGPEWTSGPARELRAALHALSEDMTGDMAMNIADQARLSVREHGIGTVTLYALGPAQTLEVTWSKLLYSWRVLGQGTDGNEHYREHAAEYARYLTASQHHDELTGLHEQLERQLRAAEREKRAAFDAWVRAGEPRKKP